jgi:hypothetical protein
MMDGIGWQNRSAPSEKKQFSAQQRAQIRIGPGKARAAARKPPDAKILARCRTESLK